MRDDLYRNSGPGATGILEEDPRSAMERAFLREVGHSLVINLFTAGKTVRLYDMSNRAMRRVLSDLMESLRTLFAREARGVLRASNDFILLNEYRIPVDSQNFAPFEYLVREMKLRRVESIEFARDVTQGDLGKFLKIFWETEPGEGAFAVLQQQLRESRVNTVVVVEWVEQDVMLRDLANDDLKRQSNRVYFRTVSLMGDVLRTIEEKHILNVRKAKRLTQQMVDIVRTDESLLVGLTSIKNFDAYTFAHSVNVCILSMLMADRIGLDKAEIARMGLAALFHDIGKTYIPSTIINSTGQLTSREWELMKYHTFFGVKELSRMNALRDATDSMFVALQHHVHVNGNGYPQRPGGWKLRLFSRIVTVADYYDAMTALRTYQKEPITPDKALRFILERSGEIFDPFIAKLFIQSMGLYPVGTVVELDTGERAVVVKQNPAPRFVHRPVVEIVDGGESAGDQGRQIADLTERVSADYRYRRSVVRTLHDTDIAVDRREIFVASSAS